MADNAVTNVFQHKIAGLPAPIVIGGGVVLVYVAYRVYSNRTASATAAATAASTDTGTGSGGGTSTDTASSPLGASMYPGLNLGGSIVTPTSGIQTLQDWQAAAENYLIGEGQSPNTVVNAINAYVNQKPTTAQDQNLITAALSYLGVPPGGALPFVNIPVPTPPNGGTGGKTPHYGLTKTKGDTAKNWGWFVSRSANNTPKGIADRYGISLSDLLALNPNLNGKTHVPLNTKVKLSSDAVAWVK